MPRTSPLTGSSRGNESDLGVLNLLYETSGRARRERSASDKLKNELAGRAEPAGLPEYGPDVSSMPSSQVTKSIVPGAHRSAFLSKRNRSNASSSRKLSGIGPVR